MCFAALLPAQCPADGDPASDYLLAENVFFPFQPRVSQPLEAALNKTVSAARGGGIPLKVALIGSAQELGVVTSLFERPQQYAAFLYREISFNEKPQLLVVMPSGFGVVPASLAGALKTVPVAGQQSSDGLARSAILAIVALAHHQGRAIALPPLQPASSPSPTLPLPLLGVPVVLLAVVGVWMALRRARSRTEAA